jgi:hypothetical protein
LAQSLCAPSSARQAEASERASSRVVARELAIAASPDAIVPLPAIPGRVYPSASFIGRQLLSKALRQLFERPILAD